MAPTSKELKNATVLFVGPVPPPITGQSVSFQHTVDVIECKKKYVINQNLEGEKVIKKLFKTVSVVISYFWYFVTKKIDIVYFTNTRSVEGSMKDMVLIILSKVFKKKIINHIHGAELQSFISDLPMFYRNLVQWAYRQINCHIILLQGMSEQLSFLHNKALIKTVPNFYDPRLDGYGVQKFELGEIKIGYFSNLLFSKGILDLITAFKQLYISNPHLRLIIAGDFRSDEYMNEAEIRAKVKEAIRDNPAIEYRGDINGNEKAEFLCSIDIFVLPTFYKSEAFPISLVEAMRCGAVIITTNHNYLKSLVNQQSGSLVPVRDPAAIEREMAKYISNPLLRMKISHFNKDKARDYFSIAAYKKTMNNIFASIAST